MTALIIVGVILLVFVLLAFIKINLHIGYDDKFNLRLSVMGITLYSTDKPQKDNSKQDEKAEEKHGSKKENIFKTIYKVKGLKYTVDLIADAIKSILNKFIWLLKRIKISCKVLSSACPMWS